MFALNGSHTLIRLSDKSKLTLNGETRLYPGSSLILVGNGRLTLGNNFRMNQQSLIFCGYSVTFGNNCSIGWQCQIYDSNMHFVYNRNNNTIGNCYGKIEIGDNVWICNRATVSKGAVLPPYSILSTGAYCNKDWSYIETQGNLFVGSPCRFLKDGFFRIFNQKTQDDLYAFFDNNLDVPVMKCEENLDYRSLLNKD